MSELKRLGGAIDRIREDKGNGQRVEWCEVHNAQSVNPVAGECWDAERLHPCRIVPKLLSVYPKEAENGGEGE